VVAALLLSMALSSLMAVVLPSTLHLGSGSRVHIRFSFWEGNAICLPSLVLLQS
jgi:hypothetical protein